MRRFSPFKIEIRNEGKVISFGERYYGEIGKDILAIKVALGLVKNTDESVSEVENERYAPEEGRDPVIPLDNKTWFECGTGMGIDIQRASTFDQRLKNTIMKFQIDNQFLITTYLFEKFGVLENLSDKSSEYYTSSNESEKYSQDVLFQITAALEIFQAELGNIREATLAVLHGWRPQTEYTFNGYRHANSEESDRIVGIVPQVLYKDLTDGKLGQTISDLESENIIYEDSHMLNSRERLATWLTQTTSRLRWLSSGTKIKFGSLDFKPVIQGDSQLYKAAIEVLENPEVQNTESLLSYDDRKNLLRTMLYPDPFSDPDPFIINNKEIGYFYRTEFVLDAAGPLPNEEPETIRRLEDEALKNVIEFYQKPDVWVFPKNEAFFQVGYFGGQDQPTPNYNPRFPTEITDEMKSFLPTYIGYKNTILAKEKELKNKLDDLGTQLFDFLPDGVLTIDNYTPEQMEEQFATWELSPREKRILKRVKELRQDIEDYNSYYSLDPRQADLTYELVNNFWCLSTEKQISVFEQAGSENLAQTWRTIESYGNTEPLIKFVEYRTPSTRPSDNYVAMFIINKEKFDLIQNGELLNIVTEEDQETPSVIEPEQCLDESPEQALRTFEEYKIHAKQRRRQLVRKLREQTQAMNEEAEERGPAFSANINMGSGIGPFDTDSAVSSLFESMGFGSLGASDYEYTSGLLSGVVEGADMLLERAGIARSDLEALNQTLAASDSIESSNVVQPAGAGNDPGPPGVLSINYGTGGDEDETPSFIGPGLSERVKVAAKDLREAGKIIQSKGIKFEPGCDFDANNEALLLENFISQLDEMLSDSPESGENFRGDSIHDFTMRDVNRSLKGPDNGKTLTVLAVTADGTRAPITASKHWASAAGKKKYPALNRPRTLNYIFNIKDMVPSTVDSGLPGLPSSSKALGFFTKDNRGACEDLGFDQKKNDAIAYVGRYTSGLKTKAERKKSNAVKSWYEVYLKDPAKEWASASEENFKDSFDDTLDEEQVLEAFGKLCTLDDIYDEFIDKVSLPALLCDFIKCLKLPGFSLKLPSLKLPPFPKVPILGWYIALIKLLKKEWKQILTRILCTFVRSIIDKLAFPFCEEQLEEFVAAGSSASDVMNKAIVDSLINTGVPSAKKEESKKFFEDSSNHLTPQELCYLLTGKPLNAATMKVLERLVEKNNLTEHLSTNEEITNYFGVLGSYVPFELCEELSTPDDDSSCSDVLDAVQAIRDKLLTGSGEVSDEELDYVTGLAKKNAEDTLNQARALSGAQFGSLVPPIYDPNNSNSLMPGLPNQALEHLGQLVGFMFEPAKTSYVKSLLTYVESMRMMTPYSPWPGEQDYNYTEILTLETAMEQLNNFTLRMENEQLQKLRAVEREELADLDSASLNLMIEESEKAIQDHRSEYQRLYEQLIETNNKYTDLYAKMHALVEMVAQTRNSIRTINSNFDLDDYEAIKGYARGRKYSAWDAPDRQPYYHGKSHEIYYENREVSKCFSGIPLGIMGGVCTDERTRKSGDYPRHGLAAYVGHSIVRANVEVSAKDWWLELESLIEDYFLGFWTKISKLGSSTIEELSLENQTLNKFSTNMNEVGYKKVFPSKMPESPGHVNHRWLQNVANPGKLSRALGNQSWAMTLDSGINFLALKERYPTEAQRVEDGDSFRYTANTYLEGIEEEKERIRARLAFFPDNLNPFQPDDPRYEKWENSVLDISNKLNDHYDEPFGWSMISGNLAKTIRAFSYLGDVMIETGERRSDILNAMYEQISNLNIRELEYNALQIATSPPKISALAAKELFRLFELQIVNGHPVHRRVFVPRGGRPFLGHSTARPELRRTGYRQAAGSGTDPTLIPDTPRRYNDSDVHHNDLPEADRNGLSKYLINHVDFYKQATNTIGDSESMLAVAESVQLATGVSIFSETRFFFPHTFKQRKADLFSTSADGPFPTSPNWVHNPSRDEVNQPSEEIIADEQKIDKIFNFSDDGNFIDDARNQLGRLSGFGLTKEAIMEARLLSESNTLSSKIDDLETEDDEDSNPELLKIVADRVNFLTATINNIINERRQTTRESHLPMLKKAFNKSEEIYSEASEEDLERIDYGANNLQLSFGDSLYSPKIHLKHLPKWSHGISNANRYDIIIEGDYVLGQVGNGQSKTFKFCDALPSWSESLNSSDHQFAVREVYANLFLNRVAKVLTETRGSSGRGRFQRSGGRKEVARTSLFDDTAESMMENIFYAMYDSDMFDPVYARELDARVGGRPFINPINECITNRFSISQAAILAFDKTIIDDIGSEVRAEMAKPENSPHNRSFDEIGATEKAAVNVAIKGFIRVCLIDLLLKGGIAYAVWDIEPIVSERVFIEYAIHHVLHELNTSNSLRGLWKGVVERITGLSSHTKAVELIVKDELLKLPNFSKQIFNPNEPEKDFYNWYLSEFIPSTDVSSKWNDQYYMWELSIRNSDERSLFLGKSTFIIEHYVEMSGEIVSFAHNMNSRARPTMTYFDSGLPHRVQIIPTRQFDAMVRAAHAEEVGSTRFYEIVEQSSFKQGCRLVQVIFDDNEIPRASDFAAQGVERERQNRNLRDFVYEENEEEIDSTDASWRLRTWKMLAKNIKRSTLNQEDSSETLTVDCLAMCVPLVEHEREISMENCSSVFGPPGSQTLLHSSDSKKFMLDNLLEKREVELLFENIFPQRKYMSIASIFATSVLGGYATLPNLFTSTKGLLATIAKITSQPFNQRGDYAMTNQDFNKFMKDKYPSDPDDLDCNPFPGDLGEMWKQFIEELKDLILQLPSILFRGIANTLDPAYKEMRQHFMNCDIKNLDWRGVGFVSVDKGLVNGLNIVGGEANRGKQKGKYVPIVPAAILDYYISLYGWPGKLPRRLLKTVLKTVSYIYSGNLPMVDLNTAFSIPCFEIDENYGKGKKYDAGKYGRYGHPLSPFTALALSTPALRSDLDIRAATCEEQVENECEDNEESTI